jgi:hypothetical protein
MFSVTLESIEYIEAGKLRPLAVTTASRLPDVPAKGNRMGRLSRMKLRS